MPFALTAGLSSLGESKLVVLGGVAELIAGAISMGIGGFLASQAERDHFQFQERSTAARVRRSCSGEMEREVHAVLGPIGVDEKLSIAVAKCLKDVEVSGGRAGANGGRGDAEEGAALKWSRDVGLTPFLLKFGEGLGMSSAQFLSYLTLSDDNLFYYRERLLAPLLHLRLYNRNGLSLRWSNPPHAIFLHCPCTRCPPLLVHSYRSYSPDIWGRESSGDRCSWERVRRISVGRC